MVLVLDHYALIERSEKHLDPPPLRKWAEEGFAVVQLLVPGRVDDGGEFPLKKALELLRGCEECEFEKGVGLICKRCSPQSCALALGEERRLANMKELRKSMACESAT